MHFLYRLFFLSFIFFACNHDTNKTFLGTRLPQISKFKVDLSYDPGKRDKSIDTFFGHLHSYAGFNGVVLVARKGKIVYENAFGFANYLKRDSLRIDSRFQLASISKQFTSLAILILKDEGKLSLQDKVTTYFSDFPYPDVTIHMLLSHRSGLPKYEYFTEKSWKDKKKAMTNKDLMEMMAQLKPAAFSRPNGHFYYNNVNYAVLAAIVEKVSGESLAGFMKKRVFDPLGMKHTSIYSKAIDTVYPTNLIGYERSFRRRDDPNWLDGIVGDKGVFSTVEDMFIWDQMLYSNQIIKQKTLQEAFMPYSKDTKGHFNYGYGWHLFFPASSTLDSALRESQGKIVYHTGWWHGYKNIFVRDIRNQGTIIILSNLFNSSINKLDPLYKLMGIPALRSSAY